MKLGMGSLISYDTGSSYILCKHLKHRIMTIQSTSLQQHYNDGHSQHTTLVSEKGCTLTAMHFSRGNSVKPCKRSASHAYNAHNEHAAVSVHPFSETSVVRWLCRIHLYHDVCMTFCNSWMDVMIMQHLISYAGWLYTIGGLDWWTGLVDWTTGPGLTCYAVNHDLEYTLKCFSAL